MHPHIPADWCIYGGECDVITIIIIQILEAKEELQGEEVVI